MIKSTIIPQLVSKIEDQVKTIVSTTIDTDLADFGTHATLPQLAGATLDYAQLNGGPRIKGKEWSMDLNGTSYNALKPAASKWSPSAFDGTQIKGKELGGYASDFVLNTVFEAGFSTGNELDITALL